MKKHSYVIIPVVIVTLCSCFLFTTLDKKISDIFFRMIPPLTEDSSVLLINIDDLSIEQVGHFPWTRDILADAIIFLREMGAETVVFDLSYLDKSPAIVDPSYIQIELPGYIDHEFTQLDDSVNQIFDAFAENKIEASQINVYREYMLSLSSSMHNSLSTSISYVSRDVDEYLAKALKFFGKSYLTLTMYSEKELGSFDNTFNMESFNVPWLEDYIALSNITAIQDSRTPEQLCMTPDLHLLLKNAKGAGFVNAYSDADGYRRRIHLLMKYKDHYYGQLIFVALLNKLGNPEVVVTNKTITLKDARINGVIKNIIIPRDEDGSVIIKWPPKKFEDYNSLSAWHVIKNKDKIEKPFIENLKTMEEYGFFGYWTTGPSPIHLYNEAEYLKKVLLNEDKTSSSEPGSFETWMDSRASFFESVEQLLSSEYESVILSNIDSEDTETIEYVSGFFADMRIQFSLLLDYRSNTRKITQGSFCIVGTTATSTTDEGLTAFQENFPNVGVHATLANMILSQDFLDDSPGWISIIIALVFSLILGYSMHNSALKNTIVIGVSGIFFSVGSLLLFFMITHQFIGVIVPLSSVSVTFLFMVLRNFLTTLREKSFLRAAFSRYLSPEVINEIIKDPTKLNLGGEKRKMTAIFTDIQGFSTISEKMDPADLVALLNIYLTEMSNIVLANKGTIDKFEGDAIIAFFGAPMHMENHAELACRTAILMKKAEQILNKKFQAEKLSPDILFTRIGINTGEMIVGNMGTANRMDYTIMGNAVNLAARLEGVNKQYNTRGILISEYTRGEIGDDFLLRRIDRVRVVGVNTPLQVFELLDLAIHATDGVRKAVTLWEEAIDMYVVMNFIGAKKLFEELLLKDPEDGVARIYISRCVGFIQNPPIQNWDGVCNLTQK